MTTLAHTWFMTLRHLRSISRQPWYIAFTLVQPVIYLVLFGSLYQRVAELPGFGADSYITFLTPGIVVMSAVFGAGWSGVGVIEDLERGVLDRFLVSPASRVSLLAGRLIQLAAVTVIQSVIIVGLGLLLGASFSGGLLGVIVLIVTTVVLAAPFGALSNAMALLAQRQESVVATVNFIQLPLMFVSSVFMATALMPGWMQAVTQFNPVDWAVTAGRVALDGAVDWSQVGIRLAYLLVFALVSAWLAVGAFRAYQRSA